MTTQHNKDTCSDTSAYAGAIYLRPTSLRYYTPEVHPPTQIGIFFEDIMHGSVRYGIVPLPSPRRLTTTCRKPQPTTSDYDLRGHWI
eukprot:4858747-Pyramimonas_sp.AAC.1